MTVDFDFVRACESDLYTISDLNRDNIPPIAIRISDEWWYREGGRLVKGTDTLGEYLYPAPNIIITLFAGNIYTYAAFRKLEAVLIAKVVLIHEIAHSVTHLGLGSLDDKCWKTFGPTDQVERFAQWATWLYIDEIRSTPLLRTFKQMSADSPEPYQRWKEDVDGALKPEQVRHVCENYQSSLYKVSLRRREMDKSILGEPPGE